MNVERDVCCTFPPTEVNKTGGPIPTYIFVITTNQVKDIMAHAGIVLTVYCVTICWNLYKDRVL